MQDAAPHLPRDAAPPVLTTIDALAPFCTRARAERLVALDTEFVWERTFLPRLGIVQLATPEEAAVVDMVALPDPAPLWDLLRDGSVEVITHAGKQDLQILGVRSGTYPERVFDTQIAAAVAGLGESIGYAPLVERLLQVTLHKIETRTDWLKRPLSERQVAYALDDVRYLLPVRESLLARLDARKRRPWLDEEFGRMQTDLRSGVPADAERYLNVKQRGRLKPRGLAILRELAAWRESEARRRDLPREWVARDALLVEISRRVPATPEALAEIPGITPKDAARNGPALLDAVRRGLAIPEGELPALPSRDGRSNGPTDSAVDVLLTVVRARAHRGHVAATSVATRADIEALVAHHLAGGAGAPPRLLTGWRKELVGSDLMRFLRGEIALRLHPKTGEPEIGSV
ncbi:MAG: ribonuclease D [Planctomycetes bacterium]|nr:ribonuclease D [Planctomycetota bacterium]